MNGEWSLIGKLVHSLDADSWRAASVPARGGHKSFWRLPSPSLSSLSLRSRGLRSRPPKTQLGVWGRCKLPSGFWGKTPAANDFGAFCGETLLMTSKMCIVLYTWFVLPCPSLPQQSSENFSGHNDTCVLCFCLAKANSKSEATKPNYVCKRIFYVAKYYCTPFWHPLCWRRRAYAPICPSPIHAAAGSLLEYNA